MKSTRPVRDRKAPTRFVPGGPTKKATSLATLNVCFVKDGKVTRKVKVEKVNPGVQFNTFYYRLITDGIYETGGNKHFEVAGRPVSVGSRESLKDLKLEDGGEIHIVENPKLVSLNVCFVEDGKVTREVKVENVDLTLQFKSFYNRLVTDGIYETGGNKHFNVGGRPVSVGSTESLKDLKLEDGGEIHIVENPNPKLVTLNVCFVEEGKVTREVKVDKVDLEIRFNSFYKRLVTDGIYKVKSNKHFEVGGRPIAINSAESLKDLKLEDGGEIHIVENPKLVSLNVCFVEDGKVTRTVKVEKVNIAVQFISFYNRLITEGVYKTGGNKHFEVGGRPVAINSTESLKDLKLEDGGEIHIVENPSLVTLNVCFVEDGKVTREVKVEKVNIAVQFISFYRRLVTDGIYKPNSNNHFEAGGRPVAINSTESLKDLKLEDGGEIHIVGGRNPFCGMKMTYEKRTIGEIKFNDFEGFKNYLRPVKSSLFATREICQNYMIVKLDDTNFAGLGPDKRIALIDNFGISEGDSGLSKRFYKKGYDDKIFGMLVLKRWTQAEAKHYGFTTPTQAAVGIEILLSQLNLITAKPFIPGIRSQEYNYNAYQAALQIGPRFDIDVDRFLYDLIMDAFDYAEFVNLNR